MILEDRFIYSVCDGQNLNSAFAEGFRLDFVSSKEQKEIVTWLYNETTQYGVTPSLERLKLHFPNYMPTKCTDAIETVISDLRTRYTFEKQQKFILDNGALLKASGNKDFRATKEAVAQMTAKLKEFVIDLEDSTGETDIADLANDSTIDNYIHSLKERRDNPGIQGFMTPWKTMNEQVGGWQDSDLIVIVARTGKGKCIAADSIIVDPLSGRRVTIKEFYNNKALNCIQSWENGTCISEVSHKIATGFKDCFKVTLRTGRSITVTPEHPFLMPDGWRRCDEIKVGETVATPTKLLSYSKNQFGYGSAHLLGLLIGDGGLTAPSSVRFYNTDEEVIDRFNKLCNYKNCTVKKLKSDPCGYYVVGAPKNNVLHMAQFYGIAGKSSKEKRIPEAIFTASTAEKAEFISGLWMTDGYISPYPEICLANKGLIDDLQHLLLRLGIVSIVKYKPTQYKGCTVDAWRLKIAAFSLNRFAEIIPLYSYKKRQLDEIASKSRNFNTGHPSVYVNNELKRFKHIKVKEENRWWYTTDIYWDEVISIEPVGLTEIYDLTVPGTHCFVANDIIVHNTYELVACADAILADSNKPATVLIESNELKVDSMMDRTAAKIACLPYSNVRKGNLSDIELEDLANVLKNIKATGHNLVISGNNSTMGGSGIAAVESRIIKYKPDIVLIDGAYLMDDDLNGRDKYIRAGNIARGLKKLAKRRNVPILITWQLNRKGAGESVDTENIGLSDDLGQDASIVMALYQTEDMKARKQMLIKVIKSRDSGTFDINAKWDFDTMDFSEYPKDLFDDDEDDILEGEQTDLENVPF